MIKIFKSKLRYEFHKIPKAQIEKYIWGNSIEFRFLKYRTEFRYINRKVADELQSENEY